jgi:hypothetical protein
LKTLLAGWPFRFDTTRDCPCEPHALQMDAWGPDDCERQIDTIIEWLREEAVRRGLPFTDMIGRMLVRRAIARSRKSTNSKPDHQ